VALCFPQWLSGSCSPAQGSKIYFHQATKDRRILLIPGIHYFDAHRLQPLLLQAPALQVHLRASPLVGPEGAGETDAIDTVEEVFAHAARNFTLRLAETLAQYICSLTRRAESLATPKTECLLYATFWFRPILSELIGAAKESADVNRERAPSGPVKVVVTNQPHSRHGVDLVSGVSALLAWFPASCASKIAPCFIGEEGGAIQVPQEVSFACPQRVFEGLQRDAVDQVLQAVKFTDKNAPGLSLALHEEFQAANCFTELIAGTQWVQWNPTS